MSQTVPGAIDISPVSTPGSLPADLPWPEPLAVLPNITIRPYHPSDAPSLAHHGNNRLIARNMPNRFPHPHTIDTASAFIARALNPTRSNVYAWAISLTPTSECIGGCILDPGPDVFCINAEIGYWISQDHWGKGFATAVCKALTDWAFEQEQGVTGHKLQRVGAGVFGGNPASGAVLRKCGFRPEGVMRGMILKWGEIRDYEIYGMQRQVWEERRMVDMNSTVG